MRVVLADVVEPTFPADKLDYRLQELENLVNTYGGVVIVKKIQKKGKPDYNTFLGKGKLEEIKSIMFSAKADLLILGNILKPKQIYNLNEYFKDINVQVWDRIDLILKIFDLHAKTPEAKLQIELAAIKHMGPRIFGMGMELSRQGGGIGTKGIGETNTEIMKRHLQKRILQIELKLKQYEKVRELHRNTRRSRRLPVVGIVGYTNAGKSSLLNVLTHKGVLAEDKLFATLGTSVGELFLSPYDLGIKNIKCEWKNCKKILLSDTIGFIQDLPPFLIKAFKSTLEDSIESDLLFHVVDISDLQYKEKIKIVNKILDDIGANQKRILILNKMDKLLKSKSLVVKELGLMDLKLNKDFFFLSTYTKEGLTDIKKFLYNYF